MKNINRQGVEQKRNCISNRVSVLILEVHEDCGYFLGTVKCQRADEMYTLLNPTFIL